MFVRLKITQIINTTVQIKLLTKNNFDRLLFLLKIAKHIDNDPEQIIKKISNTLQNFTVNTEKFIKETNKANMIRRKLYRQNRTLFFKPHLSNR